MRARYRWSRLSGPRDRRSGHWIIQISCSTWVSRRPISILACGLIDLVAFRSADLFRRPSFLEYIPGGSVGSCLRKYGKFHGDIIKSFTRDILEGLSYLHSVVVLHRVSSPFS